MLTVALFISVSLIFSTVKLGISPMPSSTKAYTTMIKLVDNTGSGPIIDLGSGWGSFVLRAAKNNPQRQIVGYELSLLPWLVSILLKKLLNLNNLTLYRQNFYNVNLSEVSVLVCFLYPEAMEKIKTKLILEQFKVEFLISNNFALPSWQSYKVIYLDDFYQSPIYLYKICKGDLDSEH
tara:strand:- start:9 stop:545 length:537 start_codon:yes stop_codon:yes gene_type:complete